MSRASCGTWKQMNEPKQMSSNRLPRWLVKTWRLVVSRFLLENTLYLQNLQKKQLEQKTSGKDLVLVAVVTQKWAEQEAACISGWKGCP